MGKKVLAFDFGASSGRAMLGRLKGGKITAREIHRFSNDTVTAGGVMYWDILRLFYEIKQAIIKAKSAGGFDCIGIDTWGVDFGLIDENGELLSNPVHYRDIRTKDMPDYVFGLIPKSEIYARTGIQHMRINTLYQLAYLSQHRQNLLKNAKKILLIPDLFAYLLTGEMHGEATIASTTNLLNPFTRRWDEKLLNILGIDAKLMPPIIEPCGIYGTLKAEICEELGCKSVPVIAVCTHDTASAVVSAPASGSFAYISCGTWSLFGTELNAPLTDEVSELANFTNEGGFGGTTRYLKNIMGLWLLQESRRQFEKQGKGYSFADMENLAKDAAKFVCFIDVDAPEFELAGNIPERVRNYCAGSGQRIPVSDGEIIRCIYESLAMKYKTVFERLKLLTCKDYQTVHMLGGGIKDTFLCQLTANALGCKVVAGPAEATVTGNIAVQLIAAGEIASIADARKIIAQSVELKTYTPENTAEFERAYRKYLDVIKERNNG